MPFLYPTSYELRQIEPELVAAQRADRLGLKLMPIRNVNEAQVRWTQDDGAYGLMAYRGLDGAPIRADLPVSKMYAYEPGVLGMFLHVTETELTTRAGGVLEIDSVPISITDLIVQRQNKLIQMELDRIEYNIWTVLQGTLRIVNEGTNGTQVMYEDSYNVQTYTAAIPWSTTSTATPIRNFQSVQQLGVGRSVDLGGSATAYMNSITFNTLLNNTNASDFGGRRINNGSTVNSLNDINSYLVAQNSPNIVVYDGGYNPRKTTTTALQVAEFVKYIPDGKVIVIGRRPGNARVGEYVMTRNANNPNFAPGSYSYIKDYANGVNAEKRTPPSIEVHRGHNGGPVLLFPSAIVIMSV
jgi:hypothetical protein